MHIDRTTTVCYHERGSAGSPPAAPRPAFLLLSIWQLGVVYDKWQNLNGAAREGARAAVVAQPGQEMSDARAAATAAVAGQLKLSSFSLRSTSVSGTAYYTATACSPYAVNILGIVVKSGSLCRDATMRVE